MADTIDFYCANPIEILGKGTHNLIRVCGYESNAKVPNPTTPQDFYDAIKKIEAHEDGKILLTKDEYENTFTLDKSLKFKFP